MIRTRAGWFHNAIGEGSDETVASLHWQAPDAPARTAAELVSGFEATWRLIRGRWRAGRRTILRGRFSARGRGRRLRLPASGTSGT